MNQTTTTKRAEKKVLNQVDKALKQSRKVALVNVPRTVRRTVKGASKLKSPPNSSHLSKWANALADPFNCLGAICPVNFNPAPSLLNTTVRLTHTSLNYQVASGRTSQITIFPGHGAPISAQQYVGPGGDTWVASPTDAVAFHSGMYNNLVSGTPTCHVGPVSTAASTGAQFSGFNVLYNDVGLGACTNGGAGSAVIGPFDSSCPFGGAYTTHLRWQLVSCGVRIFNTTPQLSRGGNITSVQLINSGGFRQVDGSPATSQNSLETNPSFKIFGDCGEGMEISWIPRLQDLAYWHSLVHTGSAGGNTYASDYSAAGMGIFLNNGSPSTQSYVIQMVFNYMIAGQSVQSISQPSVVEPLLRAPIEQSVTHMQNTSSSASVAPIVTKAATTSPSESRSMFEKLSGKAYEAAMHGAHMVGEGIVAGVHNHLRARNGPLAPRWGRLE